MVELSGENGYDIVGRAQEGTFPRSEAYVQGTSQATSNKLDVHVE